MRNKLYFYRNKEEFDKLYEELEKENKVIIPFEFKDSKELIEDYEGNYIDITNLIAFADTNKANIYSGIVNLINLDDRNTIIINNEWTNIALGMFPTIFFDKFPLYEKDETKVIRKIERKTIYYYNSNQFDSLMLYCNNNDIIIGNFASIQNNFNDEDEIIIDLSSTIGALNSNSQIVFLLEQLISKARTNIKFIVENKNKDQALKELRLSFCEVKNIIELYSEVEKPISEEETTSKLNRIIDLNADELKNFFENINSKLIGHRYFKDKLEEKLKSFILLNKMNQKKIFSLFLIGLPGLGKTEVGRIIKKYLNPNCNIIKINFGNYSSQDSLNSLIGSPAGYVGCEGGELGKKIKENNVGIIICDEFEKADSEIKNFFLELLEDGRFTDSMSREYNLDGYIIIFTSNLRNKSDFENKMSPEFQSRLNLICEFDVLDTKEKEAYINYQIEECIKKMKEKNIDVKFEAKDIQVEYRDTDDLREIKNRVLEKISLFLD